MEPRIQYAKTSDGVNIAYWTLGEGIPLVIPPILHGSHIQMEWEMPARRALYEQLAEGAKVIRYDCRGVGMSQRDAIDFSLPAAELDLEAVLDRLELNNVAMFGLGPTPGDVLFAYPVGHPERVSSLVYHAGSEYSRFRQAAQARKLIEPLMDQDLDMYLQIWVRLLQGWDSLNATPHAAMMGAAHSVASLRAALKVLDEDDPEAFFGALRAPTLILHHLGDEAAADVAQRMASKIDNAYLATVRPHPSNDPADETAAILDFISSAATESRPVVPELDPSAVCTILWTDIEGHTRMMTRLGDADGRDVLREHERITRQALAAHEGTEVKAMGDGFMAWFSSTQRAMECSVALQRAFASYNEIAGEPLHVRVALNAGEPIVEQNDLFGASVIAAARIAGQARGGDILVSDVVRQLVAGKGFLFADRGEMVLRGFDDPIRLYEVRWRES